MPAARDIKRDLLRMDGQVRRAGGGLCEPLSYYIPIAFANFIGPTDPPSLTRFRNGTNPVSIANFDHRSWIDGHLGAVMHAPILILGTTTNFQFLAHRALVAGKPGCSVRRTDLTISCIGARPP